MNKICKKTIIEDYSRYSNKPDKYVAKFIKLFRKAHYSSNALSKAFYRFCFHKHCAKNGIEISSRTNIGGGLYIGHPYNITINDGVILGKNINIHKGVTIGQENRGARKGTPIIGNNVWIGTNAIIVGKITIGDDVMVGPGAFVNFDVPSHSIVVGNPGKIVHKDNATKDYLNNRIE